MADPIEVPENDDEADTNSRKMDEELRTLGSTLRTLSALEEPARRRVIAYLAARFVAE